VDGEALHVEPWSWTLERTPEGLVLSVVCGTVGLYERAIVLNADETAVWENSGAAGLEPLVEAIRNDVHSTMFGHRYR
jgi:hypothetical protein